MKKKALMKRTAMMYGALLAAMLILLPGAAMSADPGAELLPAGEKAPLFTGVDIDGNPFSLEEELARGAVFLVFWSIF